MPTNNKVCVYCERPGHLAKDCYYNPCSTVNRNNNTKNTRKSNNKRNKTKRGSRGKRSNRKNNLNNIENLDSIEAMPINETTPCYEEIILKYGDTMDSIENEESSINEPRDQFSDNNIHLYDNTINDEQLCYEHVINKLEDLTLQNVFPNKKELLKNVLLSLSRDHNSEITTLWTFDTGASEHIKNDKSLLENFKEEIIQMQCANGSTCHFEGYGTFNGTINGHLITLERVLYSKEVNKNLIGGIKLIKSGIQASLELKNNNISLTLKNQNNDKIIDVNADSRNIIRIPIMKQSNPLFSTELDENSIKIWHNRLGHFYNPDIQKYLELHKVINQGCQDCNISKLRRKPHNKEVPRASKILETIHSDIIGPIKPTSNDNLKYILTFIDEFSRKAWVYLMKEKSEAINNILNFLKYIDNNFENKIQNFKSDNGREYNNSKIKKYCRKMGIKKIFSPPYNPENNGIAERYNQTLVNSAKTLIFWAKMSLDFWSYAVIYANFLYNITPHKNISYLIPNEIFYNKSVDLSKIKVFGCKSYYNNINNKTSKFESNSKEGIFLGLNFENNSFIIMDKIDQKLHLTREAVFLEEQPSNYIFRNLLVINEPTDTKNNNPKNPINSYTQDINRKNLHDHKTMIEEITENKEDKDNNNSEEQFNKTNNLDNNNNNQNNKTNINTNNEINNEKHYKNEIQDPSCKRPHENNKNNNELNKRIRDTTYSKAQILMKRPGSLNSRLSQTF